MSHVRRPSSVVLLFCHSSKSHFGSNGAINRSLMESSYRLMTFKQLRTLPVALSFGACFFWNNDVSRHR